MFSEENWFSNMKLDDMKTDFLFLKNQDDKLNFLDQELIELKPFGLSLNNGLARPFLILKDSEGNSLPVSISQIEAGVSIAQSNQQQPSSSPHAFVEKLLESFELVIEKCVFIEITPTHQYVRLFMKGHPKYQSFKLRADEAMSLCIHLKTPFYATREYIQKSKLMATSQLEASQDLVLQQMAQQNSLRKDYFH